jgi:geranylgeranyl diphosphate synthase, type II
LIFIEQLKEMVQLIDKNLDALLPGQEVYPEVIQKSMRYSIFAGGKRLRPVFTLAACKAVGGNMEDALPFACAIEMIHTYSLIHDDLPAMDDDDFRRGRPTNHKVFGEAMAILSGDGLLNYSFEVMTKAALEKGNPNLALRAMKEITSASGVHGMVGGQVVDLLSENTSIDIKVLDYIHSHKTGALIKASLVSGGILGGASERQLEALTKYGCSLGLAFQIIDDILDITGDENKLGKKIGSDINNNKATYPSILGIEKSLEITKQLTNDAIKALDVFDDREFLLNLAHHLLNRQS